MGFAVDDSGGIQILIDQLNLSYILRCIITTRADLIVLKIRVALKTVTVIRTL